MSDTALLTNVVLFNPPRFFSVYLILFSPGSNTNSLPLFPTREEKIMEKYPICPPTSITVSPGALIYEIYQ